MQTLLAIGLAFASGSAPDPIAIEAAIRPDRARPGGTVTIAVRLRIAAGFHIYAHDQVPAGGFPTTFELKMPSLAPEGGFRGPEPKVHTDPVLQVELREYYGEALLERTFRLAEGASPGDLKIEGIAHFQPCTEDECLFPAEEKFSLVLVVEAGAQGEPAEEAAKEAPKVEPAKEAAPPAEPEGAKGALAPGSAPRPVAIDAAIRPDRARPGGTVTIAVRFRIAEGYHIYAHDQDRTGGTPTTFELKPKSLVPEGGFRGPAPKAHIDPILQVELREHYSEALLERTFRVVEKAPAGNLAIEGVARFQPCTEKECLLPAEESFSLALLIEAGGPAAPAKGEPATAKEAVPAAEPEGVEGALSRGLWAIIAVSAAAALLSLITPCVFPMIPITVSYFAQQAKQKARAVVLLAAAYALGIMGTYVGAGVILVLAFQGAGLARIATNPWMNLFLALLFVVCGLSLLGFFELRLPQGLVGKLQAKGRQSVRGMEGSRVGIAGTALLGVSFTLVSFSCTGPIIGPLFSALATGSHRAVALAGIVTYSVVFALPFFLLALFPKALSAMPKSGGWLEVGKVTLGFVLLAVALKFASGADLIWNLGWIPRPLFLAAWCVIAGLAGLYLLGILRMGAGGEERAGPGRLLLGIAFLVLAVFIGSGIGGGTLPGRIGLFIEAFPPPEEEVAAVVAPGAQGAPGATASLPWLKTYEEGRDRAKAEGKPLLIYFTGHT